MSEATADHLDNDKLGYVDIDGIRTRYYEAGHGESLLLFHGGHFGTLYSLDSWSLNLPSLARSFRVLAFDKLGQGYTDNPQKDDDYTFTATLEHARACLQAFDAEGAHLVGHSRGGLLVARLAMTAPELVRSVTIIDSGTLAPDHPNHDIESFYAELARQRPSDHPNRESVCLEPKAQSYVHAHITEDFVERMLQIAKLPKLEEARKKMVALSDSIWQPDLMKHRDVAWEEIQQSGLPKPSLLIWGAQDPSSPLEVAYPLFEQLAKPTKIADFHVFNQAGHYVFRERVKDFNNILRAMLATNIT